MGNGNAKKKRRIAALQPINNSQLNLPSSTHHVPHPRSQAAKALYGRNKGKRQQSDGHVTTQTGRSITHINSFRPDFTFHSTSTPTMPLRSTVLPPVQTAITRLAPNLRQVAHCQGPPPSGPLILPHPSRQPLSIPLITIGQVQALYLEHKFGKVAPSAPGISSTKSNQPSLNNGVIPFVLNIPILPDFPLPDLPVIPDTAKAREALRHRSSHIFTNERSYDMAALVGDAQAEIFCREYAYNLVPHINNGLTTVSPASPHTLLPYVHVTARQVWYCT